jgi:hypothetical protein
MKSLKLLRFLFLPLCVAPLLYFSGCSLPRPPVNTTKKTVVSLTALYLSSGGRFCSAQFQGNKGIRVTIAVDNINASNGSVTSNFKTYRFNVSNDDSSKANTEFRDIEIPSSGTFAVTVTSEATVCYTCCYNSNGTCGSSGGIPYYRGVSTVYNSSSSPTFIQVVPRYANCF